MKQLISVNYDDKKQLHIDIDDTMTPGFALEVLGKTVQTLRRQAEKIKAVQSKNLL